MKITSHNYPDALALTDWLLGKKNRDYEVIQLHLKKTLLIIV